MTWAEWLCLAIYVAPLVYALFAGETDLQRRR
jgi:hypothetical protein